MTDTLNRLHVLQLMTTLVAAFGATPRIRLFTEGPALTEAFPVIEEFSEPVGDWYDIAAAGHPRAEYGEVYRETDGSYTRTCVSRQFNFDHDGTLPPVEIRGWFVTGNADDVVHHFNYLPQPVQLVNEYDSVIVAPSISLRTPLAGE